MTAQWSREWLEWAGAAWLQEDARYSYAAAARYRDAGDDWLAVKVQEVAAHSASLAREAMELGE